MILDRIERIEARLGKACARSGRNRSEITLLAVSKTFSAGAVREAVDAGVADIGENYVQELVRKQAELAALPVRWHFIGHLQTNKVKYVAEWIHLIHSLESVSLARELEKQGERIRRVFEVLVEVNTTGETSKYGVSPEDAIGFVRSLAGLEHIKVVGLMTMGLFLPDPEASRPMFKNLRLVKDEISRLGQANVEMKHLSMGMTGDFEVAIEEGATIVRIGTAIFGKRVRPERTAL